MHVQQESTIERPGSAGAIGGPSSEKKGREEGKENVLVYSNSNQGDWSSDVNIDRLKSMIRNEARPLLPNLTLVSGNMRQRGGNENQNKTNKPIKPLMQQEFGVKSQSLNNLNRLNATRATAVYPIPSEFPFNELHNFQLVCSQCFTDGKISVVKHSCHQDTFAVQSKATKQWSVVRERKNHPDFRGSYQLCSRMLASGRCSKKNDCSFAHNQEELMLWKLDKSGKFRIGEFMEKNRTIVQHSAKHFRCRACQVSRPVGLLVRGMLQKIPRLCLFAEAQHHVLFKSKFSAPLETFQNVGALQRQRTYHSDCTAASAFEKQRRSVHFVPQYATL